METSINELFSPEILENRNLLIQLFIIQAAAVFAGISAFKLITIYLGVFENVMTAVFASIAVRLKKGIPDNTSSMDEFYWKMHGRDHSQSCDKQNNYYPKSFKSSDHIVQENTNA